MIVYLVTRTHWEWTDIIGVARTKKTALSLAAKDAAERRERWKQKTSVKRDYEIQRMEVQ